MFLFIQDIVTVLILKVSFFFTAVSLSGSGEGCWSLQQLHMDGGKVLPCMSCQLIRALCEQ